MATSRQINCPAPLPEGLADARLAKLLVPASYVVPEKKATKRATGTRKSARRQEVLDPSSDGSEAHSSREDEEEEEETSPLKREERRKGRPPSLGRPEGPRRGKPFLWILHRRRRRRRGVAAQGQAPGKIVSIRIPE